MEAATQRRRENEGRMRAGGVGDRGWGGWRGRLGRLPLKGGSQDGKGEGKEDPVRCGRWTLRGPAPASLKSAAGPVSRALCRPSVDARPFVCPVSPLRYVGPPEQPLCPRVS